MIFSACLVAVLDAKPGRNAYRKYGLWGMLHSASSSAVDLEFTQKCASCLGSVSELVREFSSLNRSFKCGL